MIEFSTYVIEPKLYNYRIKIPTYNPRNLQGVNIIFIKMQSTLIGLILNPEYVSMSTQLHVVYDYLFTNINTNK